MGGRGDFSIWKEKVADSKISGKAWTGPKVTAQKFHTDDVRARSG